jgi:DNA-binding response OmpR family regulator
VARILIIDDDEMFREMLARFMETAGHAVASASDGEKGLKAYARFRPDLVITDIMMPEKEGLETIAELRALRRDLPIIAVSGGGQVVHADFLSVAERAGASRTFHKPFEPAEMTAAVASLLRATARPSAPKRS